MSETGPRQSSSAWTNAVSLRALAVFLLISLSGLAIAGYSGAVDHPAPQTSDDTAHLPETFSTAAPRIGDTFVYSVENADTESEHPTWVEGRWNMSRGLPEPGASTQQIVDLESKVWTGPKESANAVRPTFEGILRVDAGSGMVVARTVDQGFHYGSPGETRDILNPLETRQEDRRYHDSETVWASRGVDDVLTCGIWHAAQGTAFKTSQPIDLLPRCALPSGDGLDSTLRFVVQGNSTVRGLDALHLTTAPIQASNDTGDQPLVEAWLHPTIPYPLQLLITDGDQGSTVLELVHFEPGTGADIEDAGIPTEALPALRQLPVLPTGANDTTTADTFDSTTAFEQAIEHPTDSRVRDFLSERPGHVIVASARFDWTTDRDEGPAWAFIVGGDGEDLHFLVGSLRTKIGGLDPANAPPRTEIIDYEEREFAVGPTEWPENLPDLQDSIRWAERLGQGDDWDAISYGSDILDFDDPLETQGFPTYRTAPAQVHVHLARESVTSSQSGTNSAETVVRENLLMKITEDGELHSIVRSTTEESVNRSLILESLSPPEAGPAWLERDTDAPTTMASQPTWSLPAPETTIRIAGTALIVAAAYVVAAKLSQGVGAGLFTRIQTAKALDHPTRRSLRDAVAASPGIHLADLQKATGTKQGTARHHLRMLVQAGLVQQVRQGRTTRFFVDEAQPTTAARHATALASETARLIKAALDEDPTRSSADIARQLGISRQAVSQHRQRIEEADTPNSLFQVPREPSRDDPMFR